MTMEVRTARLKAGTLKTKEQARADREKRKKGNDDTTGAGNVTIISPEANFDVLTKLIKDLKAKKITEEEFDRMRAEGPQQPQQPMQHNSTATAPATQATQSKRI